MPRVRQTERVYLTPFDVGAPAWACPRSDCDHDSEDQIELQNHFAEKHSSISLITDFEWIKDGQSCIDGDHFNSLKRQELDTEGNKVTVLRTFQETACCMECLIADQGEAVVFSGNVDDAAIDKFNTQNEAAEKETVISATCVACGNSLCEDCMRDKTFLHYLSIENKSVHIGDHSNNYYICHDCVGTDRVTESWIVCAYQQHLQALSRRKNYKLHNVQLHLRAHQSVVGGRFINTFDINTIDSDLSAADDLRLNPKCGSCVTCLQPHLSKGCSNKQVSATPGDFVMDLGLYPKYLPFEMTGTGKLLDVHQQMGQEMEQDPQPSTRPAPKRKTPQPAAKTAVKPKQPPPAPPAVKTTGKAKQTAQPSPAQSPVTSQQLTDALKATRHSIAAIVTKALDDGRREDLAAVNTKLRGMSVQERVESAENEIVELRNACRRDAGLRSQLTALQATEAHLKNELLEAKVSRDLSFSLVAAEQAKMAGLVSANRMAKQVNQDMVGVVHKFEGQLERIEKLCLKTHEVETEQEAGCLAFTENVMHYLVGLHVSVRALVATAATLASSPAAMQAIEKAMHTDLPARAIEAASKAATLAVKALIDSALPGATAAAAEAETEANQALPEVTAAAEADATPVVPEAAEAKATRLVSAWEQVVSLETQVVPEAAEAKATQMPTAAAEADATATEVAAETQVVPEAAEAKATQMPTAAAEADATATEVAAETQVVPEAAEAKATQMPTAAAEADATATEVAAETQVVPEAAEAKATQMPTAAAEADATATEVAAETQVVPEAAEAKATQMPTAAAEADATATEVAAETQVVPEAAEAKATHMPTAAAEAEAPLDSLFQSMHHTLQGSPEGLPAAVAVATQENLPAEAAAEVTQEDLPTAGTKRSPPEESLVTDAELVELISQTGPDASKKPKLVPYDEED
ncbi:TPA: hypothetical protein ACH3X1_015789 [Trebouxia sp. C0004]